MHDDASVRITYLGRTTHRNGGIRFGIRQRDRRSHLYCCGKTGTGKSHFLRTMFAQDVAARAGCALFDPHGDLAREIVADLSNERQRDLVYLDATNPCLAWRFNPFAGVPDSERALAAANLVDVFKKLWPDDWGPRLEHLLRNVVFALLATPGASLADIPPLLTDRDHRRRIVSVLADPIVRDFWTREFEGYSFAFRAVVTAPLLNKVGALLTDPVLRRILTEAGTAIDLRGIMDEGKILVVNLDKGQIGEGPSSLLGSLLLSHIGLAGLSRSKQPEDRRRDHWVYADEFQTFTTLSLATMLAELRKYRVGLTLSHQHLSQLDPAIRDAVFGNVGTIVTFRVGAADAAYLAREFAPVFSAEDLIALERYHVYIRLSIDGEQSKPFSAMTLGSLDELPGARTHLEH